MRAKCPLVVLCSFMTRLSISVYPVRDVAARHVVFVLMLSNILCTSCAYLCNPRCSHATVAVQAPSHTPQTMPSESLSPLWLVLPSRYAHRRKVNMYFSLYCCFKISDCRSLIALQRIYILFNLTLFTTLRNPPVTERMSGVYFRSPSLSLQLTLSHGDGGPPIRTTRSRAATTTPVVPGPSTELPSIAGSSTAQPKGRGRRGTSAVRNYSHILSIFTESRYRQVKTEEEGRSKQLLPLFL